MLTKSKFLPDDLAHDRRALEWRYFANYGQRIVSFGEVRLLAIVRIL